MIAGVRDFDVEALVDMARQAFAQGTYLLIVEPQKLGADARKRIYAAGRRHVNFQFCRSRSRGGSARERSDAGRAQLAVGRNVSAEPRGSLAARST